MGSILALPFRKKRQKGKKEEETLAKIEPPVGTAIGARG